MLLGIGGFLHLKKVDEGWARCLNPNFGEQSFQLESNTWQSFKHLRMGRTELQIL